MAQPKLVRLGPSRLKNARPVVPPCPLSCEAALHKRTAFRSAFPSPTPSFFLLQCRTSSSTEDVQSEFVVEYNDIVKSVEVHDHNAADSGFRIACQETSSRHNYVCIGNMQVTGMNERLFSSLLYFFHIRLVPFFC